MLTDAVLIWYDLENGWRSTIVDASVVRLSAGILLPRYNCLLMIQESLAEVTKQASAVDGPRKPSATHVIRGSIDVKYTLEIAVKLENHISVSNVLRLVQ